MNERIHERPLTIAMLALGGQGGGVLTNWLVDLAQANGYVAQSTYVAGVAQRTGATVYCVEMFPLSKTQGSDRPPVFTSYPIPGDVDIVVAGEMAESGRAIQKGFVTPNITTLIASSHRVYSIKEKEHLGDGIIDMSKVASVAREASRQFVCFDMQSCADETGSVISAVMFGAIAASGRLPFDRNAYESVIRATGKSVNVNLAGFAAGFDGASSDSGKVESGGAPVVPIEQLEPAGPNGEALIRRIKDELPQSVQKIAILGALRALDYQDVRYAHAYLDRINAFLAVDDEQRSYALTGEFARQLILQMCYEDTIRVADLKTRSSRVDRIRAHVAAADGQPVHVFEYLHPRLEEVCDTLPRALGKFLLHSRTSRRILAPLFAKGRTIQTSSVSGFLLLRAVAKLKRFRRATYRYPMQIAFIDDWQNRVEAAASSDYDLALSLAKCVEIVRGYGSTYERGLRRFERILAVSTSTQAVSELHNAALLDEQGVAFDAALEAVEVQA